MNQKFKVVLLSSMVLAACSVNAQNLVYTANSSLKESQLDEL